MIHIPGSISLSQISRTERQFIVEYIHSLCLRQTLANKKINQPKTKKEKKKRKNNQPKTKKTKQNKRTFLEALGFPFTSSDSMTRNLKRASAFDLLSLTFTLLFFRYFFFYQK